MTPDEVAAQLDQRAKDYRERADRCDSRTSRNVYLDMACAFEMAAYLVRVELCK